MSNAVMGVFVDPKESYKRDIDPVKHYAEDAALYLHLETGKPLEFCRAFVDRKIQEKLKDPEVMYLERGENGDREQKVTSLLGYINDSKQKRELIAGTFTTYSHPKRKRSPYVQFIDDNVKKRGIHKKAMFRAEQAGDMVNYVIEKNNQANKKINNNSLSGAHNSGGTPLFNKTAHSTLTSTCRITSGYGNANNERMVAGNRHYHKPDVALNNLVSILGNTDYAQLEATMNEFSLVAPTKEQVMQMVRRCSKNYWRSERAMKHIENFVAKLNPLQLAAILYTGDLYSISLYNEAMVREFILKLAQKVTVLAEGEVAETWIHKTPEDFVSLAKQICASETRGLQKIDDIKGTPGYDTVAATTKNICDTLIQYKNFMRTFFVTSNLPPSLAYLPTMVRDVAITSDTDSTIFTVERWVEWTNGKIGFSEHDNAVAAVMITLASQVITHILAIMSANFGVVTERIHQIAMKNEFKFDVFVATQMTKHYYAIISCQEGNVFKDYKTELKGVHMKNSNAPAHINKLAKETMEEIMYTIVRGEKIKLTHYLTKVADLERMVKQEISAGTVGYFRKGNLKQPEAYTKSETESPYSNYTLWTDVFEPKYGKSPPPPFDGIRISLTTDSPARMKEYLENMKDRELAERLRQWLGRHNKSYVGSVIISREVLTMIGGIPEELMEAMDIRGMVYNVCTTFYHILETLGVYAARKGSNIPVLMSDHY